MKTHTENLTVLRDAQGQPAFVILPVVEYERLVGEKRNEADYVPAEVVERIFINRLSPVRAWREYLDLNQADVANNMGITQSAYSKIELKAVLKPKTRAQVAKALGIFEEQLNLI
jgi:predicted XRE-type DNA-binding protein